MALLQSVLTVARYFTLAQARKYLPEAERLLRQVIALKRENERAEADLNHIQQRVSMMGGMALDTRKVAADRARLDATGTRLKETMAEVESIGFEIKDLEMGLLDFPSLYRGEEVCLCFKLGETDIEYWHGSTEGFRGRKPIDQEFLDHHRGDPAS